MLSQVLYGVYRSIPLLFFSMCMLPSLFLSLSLQ